MNMDGEKTLNKLVCVYQHNSKNFYTSFLYNLSLIYPPLFFSETMAATKNTNPKLGINPLKNQLNRLVEKEMERREKRQKSLRENLPESDDF